jgi:hypothetical protein
MDTVPIQTNSWIACEVCLDLEWSAFEFLKEAYSSWHSITLSVNEMWFFFFDLRGLSFV